MQYFPLNRRQHLYARSTDSSVTQNTPNDTFILRRPGSILTQPAIPVTASAMRPTSGLCNR